MGWLAASMLCLLLSHSRTPLVAGTAGFLAGLAAMFVSSQRARRLVSWTLFFVPVAALLFGPAVQSWFLRGQDESQLTTLTGRTKAWAKVYAFPRDVYSQWFGIGLTDKSIEGISIDSGYLSIYHEQGRIGIAVIVVVFVAYLARILARRPSMPRAIALFLVVYVLIASYTETGIGDMSSYVLHLVLAMVMVVMPIAPRADAAPAGAVPA
jgi:O-antigen ligase